MGVKLSLLDINFKQFSTEEKRAALVMMDLMLKKLHQSNLMVSDFSPSQIYYEDGIYSFNKVSPISDYYIDNKEKAVLRNMLGLSNLAFCSYLPDYDLKNGLLSYDVINQNFNEFSGYLPDIDREYYKSIIVDSYNNKKLVNDNVYFSDYVVKKHQSSSNNKSSSLAYVKATEAGRAFKMQDEEAAFGSKFFILTIVTSFTILLAGVLFFLYNYLG